MNSANENVTKTLICDVDTKPINYSPNILFESRVHTKTRYLNKFAQLKHL